MKSALRRLREARGLSQREVARQAGVHRAYVSTLERRRQPDAWAYLCRIADTLGVTTDAVLGRGEPPAAPVDALSRQDRELLNAMREQAEHLVGPQVVRLAGGWRNLALMSFAGTLYRIRDHGVERPTLPPAQVVQELDDAQRRYRAVTGAKARR